MELIRTISTISFEALQSIAAESGLLCVGVTDASDLSEDRVNLEQWQQDGMAAAMKYMERDSTLLSSPRRLLPNCRSIVSFMLPYSNAPHPERPSGFGRIARYAWGRDYHKVFPTLMREFVSRVKSYLGISVNARIFSDAVPLLERGIAKRGGLGFVGKNTLLIRPGIGSFSVLGEILWDLEVVGEAESVKRSCGSCERCKTGCPTGALVDDYRLDARLCISYLTIEKRGIFTNAETEMIGEWLFGCDLCQDPCPFNHRALKGLVKIGSPLLLPEAGVGALLALDDIFCLKDDRDFVKRFSGTPIIRAKREGLIRNGCAVAANTGLVECLPALRRIAVEDPSLVVRESALQSIERLSI
jgi:epoxyqueuosine reductase